MKVRLPLSLLFACAVSAVVSPAFASTAATSSASIVGPAKPTSVFDDKYLSKQWQWYLTKNGVNIVPVWQAGITGSGVVIGIMDTWVEPNHEDLNVSPYNPTNDAYNGQGLSKDFVGSEVIPTDNPDTEEDESQTQIYTSEGEEHGQFVAGMAAAVGGNDKGVVGAAPGATIAGLHINLSNIQTILNAAYWGSGVSASGAYENEALIQVKNCSFGSVFQQGSEDEKKFWKAIADTSANNVIYVFAAGNSRGEDGTNWPGSTGWDSTGSNPNIINVGATNDSGRYTSFSCFGSNLFVTAPGEGVVSTDRTGELGYNAGGVSSSESTDDGGDDSSVRKNSISNPNYASSDGTSFSAPLVAGVIALGKQVCPVMDTRWAKHALAYSSGGGDAPNIDSVWDEQKKTYVQKSGYKETTVDEETGEVTETTGISTGEWVRNSGGLWFNNNYGFGMVDPEGFVKKVRDIAYTTVSTSYSATSSEIIKAAPTSGTTEATGTTRAAEFAVSTTGTGEGGKKYSLLDQRVETVSVTVNFADPEISGRLNLSSLKVILTDPNGIQSVLVQGSSGDPDVPRATVDSYKFLSNAFWGSAYTNPGDWTIRVEYDGVVDGGVPMDMTDWVSVSAVDFTMGQSVSEGNLYVSGKTVNAHALVLDRDSFTVGSGGKFYVEDAVYVNGGSFVLADGGEVRAYENEALKKGAVFVQTGGSASIQGMATFERGIHVNGGTFNLYSTVVAGAGTFVNGGTFVVHSNIDGFAIEAGTVTVNGGRLVMESNANFSSVVAVNNGYFEAKEASRGTTLSVLGGLAELKNKSQFGSISAGQDATDGVEEKGGQISFSGKVKTGGVSLKGNAVVVVNSGGQIDTDSAVGVSGNAILNLYENTAITSSVSVGGNATLAWTGTTRIPGITVSGGALVAYGETTLDTDGVGVVLKKGATFKSGRTALSNGSLTVEAGAVLEFASRSRKDSDLLVLDSLVLGMPDNDATPTSLKYDFGDAIPYKAEVLRLKTPGETFTQDTRNAAEAVLVSLGEGTPKILTETTTGNFVSTDLKFSLKELVVDNISFLALSSTQVFDNLHLCYGQQTSQQSAIQTTLLRNQSKIAPLHKEINALESVSELLTTYDKLGAPANVVAINELHEKQASAITGAVSRRSRELRSGFIHYDVWSNPLLGNSGFSFSARPNQVAAKGFVPYAVEDVDYPLMVWANGGYSFSEADDGAMSVSSTKSNMLNLLMGADYSVSENLALGVFIGYAGGRTKFDDGSRTEIQSRNIGVYLTGSKTDKLGGSYYGTAIAAFGFEEYDFTRKFSLGAINTEAQASPEGWQGILFFEGGYEWKLDKFSMGPTLSARYVSNNIDGYTESSEDAWLSQEVDDVSYDSLQTSLGWRIAYRADFETVSILPEIRASWNHEFLGTDEDFDAKLALPNADSYTCTIADTGDDYMTLGAGLTMMLGDVSTISVDYDVQIMRDDADPVHSVNAMFRTRF